MRTLYALFISAVILFGSCEDSDEWFDDNRIVGFGTIESDIVPVNEFSAIDLECVANVYVSTGTPQEVKFTAYSNILPYMQAQVVGDELLLRITDDMQISSDEEIRVDITVEDLDKITLSGVGNYDLKGSYQESIEIELNGVGNVAAFGLPVFHAIVEINGTGNVEVSASETLEVDIDGLGNVYYKGNPDITADISGLGTVIKDQ